MVEVQGKYPGAPLPDTGRRRFPHRAALRTGSMKRTEKIVFAPQEKVGLEAGHDMCFAVRLSCPVLGREKECIGRPVRQKTGYIDKNSKKNIAIFDHCKQTGFLLSYTKKRFSHQNMLQYIFWKKLLLLFPA